MDFNCNVNEGSDIVCTSVFQTSELLQTICTLEDAGLLGCDAVCHLVSGSLCFE